MCPRNAVIVGDSMQLPNVITDADRLRMQAIASKHAIDPPLRLRRAEFLESVCRVFPEAPQTLLREHYRGHPKIINFCNQRFTAGVCDHDRGSRRTRRHRSVADRPGHHARGAFNPRESRQSGARCCRHSPCEQTEIGIISPATSRSMRSTAKRRAEALTCHGPQVPGAGEGGHHPVDRRRSDYGLHG